MPTNRAGCIPQVMDWFFFHVDPSISCSGALKAGWAPHRDRGQDEAAQQFRVDGTPRYNTTWIPLTNATPSNSCLMCVPKPYDEGYLQGELIYIGRNDVSYYSDFRFLHS